MNHVTDDTFVYFTIFGSVYKEIFLFALVLSHKCFITPMHFACRMLMWIFDLNYANEVSRSTTLWMTNLQDLIKTVSTFSVSIVLSIITKVRGHMNSFSPVSEQVLECLSQWIILNQRGLMNCRKLVWISYMNGTCYCEIEKILHFFVLR
jgi:hypothetical protein